MHAINIINAKSYHVSAIIIKEIILVDAIDLATYAQVLIIEITIICRSHFLNETINLDNPILESLTENLETKNINKKKEPKETSNNEILTNRYRQHYTTVNDMSTFISATILSNLLEISNSTNSASNNFSNTSNTNSNSNLFKNIENIKESVKYITVNTFKLITLTIWLDK